MGDFGIIVNKRALTNIILPNKLKLTVLKPTHENDYFLIMKEARTQLIQYFKGNLKNFILKKELNIPTFYKNTLNAVESIAYGNTRSYKEIAINICSPNGHRAVANANAKNPIPIVIPCHRVVKSNGEFGNYGGGSMLKKNLLQFERFNIKE